MHRFYCSPQDIKADTISIKDKEAHHIAKVMRLKEKDAVVVFDGKGKEYVGFIQKVLPKEVMVKIQEVKSLHQELRYPKITLAIALPKKGKMDYIIEKCTELGVDTIIPIRTERTIVSPKEDKKSNRIARWEKIAIEASKQSRRTVLPILKQIKQFNKLLLEVRDHDLSLLFCLTDEKREELPEILSKFKGEKVLSIIGPEGDFTPQEINLAKEAGCKLASLGQRILKVDTAATAIMAILNYEFWLRFGLDQ
jgi:16S rRNA (uracil1498-N3)-methyltransferase